MSKLIDLTGQRFGRLVVIKRSEEDYVSPKGSHKPVWICKCDCGCIKNVTGEGLKRRGTKSCGCLCKEKHSKNSKKNNQNNIEVNIQVNNKKEDVIVEKVVDKMDNRVDNNANNNVSFADAYSKFEKWLNDQKNKTINVKSTMLWSALKFASDLNIIDEDAMKKTYGEFMFKQMDM